MRKSLMSNRLPSLNQHQRSGRVVTLATTYALLIATMLGTAVACSNPAAVPTIANIRDLGTQVFQTENAPPPDLQSNVNFDQIEANLAAQTSWSALVIVNFEGAYSATNQGVTGQISAEIFANQGNADRRVVLTTQGEAFGTLATYAEGVRAGGKYYLVNQSKACSAINDATAKRIAELRPSELVGGVRDLQYTLTRKTINGLPAWEYAFGPAGVIPPAITVEPGGEITIASGGLWIAATQKVVAQYQISYNVRNVSIQGSQPLSGQLRIIYELKALNTPLDIAIPFGC